MKSYVVNLSKAVESERIDGQLVVHVHASAVEAKELVIALSLLREQLVGSITVLGASRSPLTLTREVENKRTPVLANRNGKLSVALPLDPLETALSFYLIYCRDGFADVDHLDLEADDGSYLTFCADDAKPPISGEELARLLKKEGG